MNHEHPLHPLHSLDIARAIRALVHGPEHPEREFIKGGATVGDVYAMAAHLRTTLTGTTDPGQSVCLAAENRAVVAAALLAALAGGPPLLLPYAFSGTALKAAQRAIAFSTAITDTARELPAGVDTLSPEPSGSWTGPAESEISPQAELLTIFTGGSTGAPQAWSKTAENIIGEGLNLATTFSIGNRDCILATIPPYHIYGLLFSVALPLISSASVIEETPVYPGEIERVAEQHRATVLVSVPAHYRVLQERALPHRLAFSSAGRLDSTVNSRFCARNAGIVEVYGSTETGGIALRNCSSGEKYFTPFQAIRWKIIDHHLAVRSPFLSPDLPVEGDGFFVTSDLVEQEGTNAFSLKGRADNVAKVGGKRVNLDEIGVLIQNAPGVSDCVVTALPEASGREHCIAALIQGEQCTVADIKKTLAATLEPYARPRLIKTTPRIPVKANGKYDWPAIKELLEK